MHSLVGGQPPFAAVPHRRGKDRMFIAQSVAVGVRGWPQAGSAAQIPYPPQSDFRVRLSLVDAVRASSLPSVASASGFRPQVGIGHRPDLRVAVVIDAPSRCSFASGIEVQAGVAIQSASRRSPSSCPPSLFHAVVAVSLRGIEVQAVGEIHRVSSQSVLPSLSLSRVVAVRFRS
jgi:hypothetical protein